MNEREKRRALRERWFQNLAFAAAAVVLGLVLFLSFVVQSNRRAQETLAKTVTPGPTAERTPAPTVRATLAPQRTAPPYPLPGEGGLLPINFVLSDPGGVLDPARIEGDRTVLHYLFFGLTTRSPDGERLLPGLAESWEVLEDGSVYVFILRSDVVWVKCDPGSRYVYDQRQVTADDVVFAIERALDPETGAPYAEVLYPIAGAQERHQGSDEAVLGVEALGRFVLLFTVISPTVDLPELLAEPVAWPVPAETIEAYGDAWTEPGKIWVNGAFCPTAWVPGQVVSMVRNPWLPADFLQIAAESVSRLDMEQYGQWEVQGSAPFLMVVPYPTVPPE